MIIVGRAKCASTIIQRVLIRSFIYLNTLHMESGKVHGEATDMDRLV